VYADIQKAVQSGGDNVTDKVLAAIQEASNKVQQLSSQLSVSALQPYLEKNPQLKSAINDSLSQLNEFSGKYGPEAKKIAEDTVNQIKDIADKGLTGESIMKASALAKEKLKQIQDLGAKAGSEAYAKAAEGARPYLDKAPDVKKYLEDSIGGLKEYVGDDGVKLINDTYADLEKAGKKGDSELLSSGLPVNTDVYVLQPRRSLILSESASSSSRSSRKRRALISPAKRPHQSPAWIRSATLFHLSSACVCD